MTLQDPFLALLDSSRKEDENKALLPIQIEARRELIQELQCSYNTPTSFIPGDFIEYKPGLKNKKSSSPCMVVEVLDHPIIDIRRDTGTPYFREPLDIRCAELSDEGTLLHYYYDSRRFQLAPPPTTDADKPTD